MKYLASLLFAVPFFLLITQQAEAQLSKLEGFVYDAQSREPVAFASITVNNSQKKGTVTDIDGRFLLSDLPYDIVLTISHVGYQKKEVTLTKDAKQPLIIFVDAGGTDLENVIILPGENPAHRIIRLLQQNKKKHDPAHISSFKYNAYTNAAVGSGNKLWMMNTDSIKTASTKKTAAADSLTKEQKEAQELLLKFKENYLFITESYTERIFRYPKQSKETLLAVKMSGIKSPKFGVTSSNFQPFGFYDDYLQLGDKPYVNPLINGSIGMYRFKLLETKINVDDTTFIISFQPKKNANFLALKGTLYINSNGYALESVTAGAADEKGLIMRYRMQQKYAPANGQWFPVQLNSTVAMADLVSDSILVYWDTRSYITNAVFGIPLSIKDFADVALENHPNMGKRTPEEWNQFRTDSLKIKEKNTYDTYASLPKKALDAFEKINSITETLALQAFTAGKVDLPFKYLFSGINRYEKFRLGAGFQTNEYLSKSFSFGGFAGYGFGDKAWKYGGNLQLLLNKRTATSVTLSYNQNIEEPGNTDYFAKNNSFLSRQTLRNFYAYRFDSITRCQFDITTKLRPGMQTVLWLLHEKRKPAAYNWAYNDNNGKAYRNFINTEAGLGIRLTIGEKFSMIGRAKVLLTPATTELHILAAAGISGLLNGQLSYTKVSLQLSHRFRFKKLGETSIQINAGSIWGNAPYAYLFTTPACAVDNQKLSLYIPNSFQTAGLYEFVADKSISFIMQHNFGHLLFKPKNVHFRPEFILVQAINYGSLKNAGYQKGIAFKTPEKGLYETGVMVDNIYRISMQFVYFGIGAGVFYRYGVYRQPQAKDNLALKIGVRFTF